MSGKAKIAKNISTIAARANGYVDPLSGGVTPPMQPSTTFLRDENYDLVVPGNSYGRDNNDQIRLAEDILCAMEGGAESLLFATGMASIAALVSCLRAGDKFVIQQGCYWGTLSYLRDVCLHRGIVLIETDATDLAALTDLIDRERPAMVFVEVPSNPWIRVCDIEKISIATRRAGSVLVVDGTAATPVLLKALALGADIAMHSVTKAINGHSDVLGGVLTCADTDHAVWKHVCKHRHGEGAILSAHAAWLVIRGMRTLPLRIERMCENAQAIAEHLDNHPKVAEVWYPGLAGHPEHKRALEMMPQGAGYLMSFLIKGSRAEALTFCRHLDGIHRATSLGGTESLVEHRHTIEGDLTGCPDNLIRLSVGIENVKDLIDELDQALAHV